MQPDDRTRFFKWIGKFEGLYLNDGSMWQSIGLDIEARPCCALGVDLPDPSTMAKIVWRHGKTTAFPAATYAEVCHEWARVRAMAVTSPAGTRSYPNGAASLEMLDSAHLWLDPESLYAYCSTLLAEMEAELARTMIPSWEKVRPIAHIARARTLWADGEHSRWPKLDAAIEAGNWAEAAAQCTPEDYARQNPRYQASYRAVKQMYLLAPNYPGDLPDILPGD